jgi:hypothetical protein
MTTSVRLFVKGTMAQARAAVEARGFVVEWARDILHGQSIVQARATQEDYDRVVAWFAEDQPCNNETGFPVGTLLFYSDPPSVGA